jgi:hypothetical protein
MGWFRAHVLGPLGLGAPPGVPPTGPMQAAEASIARAQAAARAARGETLLARIRRWERAQPTPRTRDELDAEQARLDRLRWDADQEALAEQLGQDGVWAPAWRHQDVPRDEPGVWLEMRW